MTRLAAAVLLLALLGVAACGDDEPAPPAQGAAGRSSGEPSHAWTYEMRAARHALKSLLDDYVPPWAKVSPEQIAEAKKHGVPVALENELGMRFVLIPAGTFRMGSSDTERRGPAHADRYKIEDPQHRVTLNRSFYLSIHEVTNGQYRQMNPSHKSGTELDGDSQPVVEVSHTEAAEFAIWLSRRHGERRFRLPTEAEWERACRSGSTTPFSFGEMISTDDANYCGYIVYGEDGSLAPDESGVYRERTTDVGTLGCNAWGIYDMHGNVAEWCADWCGPYPSSSQTDPQGPSRVDAPIIRYSSYNPEFATYTFRVTPKQQSKARVVRGGHWHNDPSGLRCVRRDYAPPTVRDDNIGFRLVSPLPEPRK